MADDVNERIKAHLARHGVTGEEHVNAALEAQAAGVDVEGIMNDLKAGVPQWLALLRALLALLGNLGGGAPPTKSTRKDK